MSFDPYDHDRPSRAVGFKEETEKIGELLHERGDQRIGQLVINAIRKAYDDEIPDGTVDDEQVEEVEDKEQLQEIVERERGKKANAIEQILWSIEDDKMAEILEEYVAE